MPRAAVVPALLVALAYPLEAPGDPVPASVRLAWVRGADADACPDGAWLRDEVTRRLGRDPFDDDGPRASRRRRVSSNCFRAAWRRE